MAYLLASSSVSMAIFCEIWKLAGGFQSPKPSVVGGLVWYCASLCIFNLYCPALLDDLEWCVVEALCQAVDGDAGNSVEPHLLPWPRAYCVDPGWPDRSPRLEVSRFDRMNESVQAYIQSLFLHCISMCALHAHNLLSSHSCRWVFFLFFLVLVLSYSFAVFTCLHGLSYQVHL